MRLPGEGKNENDCHCKSPDTGCPTCWPTIQICVKTHTVSWHAYGGWVG